MPLSCRQGPREIAMVIVPHGKRSPALVSEVIDRVLIVLAVTVNRLACPGLPVVSGQFVPDHADVLFRAIAQRSIHVTVHDNNMLAGIFCIQW